MMIKNKLKRVIHILEDGRRKYSTYRGEVEKWTDSEIKLLLDNIEKYGYSAFLADFSKYDVTVKGLRNRYPTAKIIRVIAIEIEDHDLPLNDNIIF